MTRRMAQNSKGQATVEFVLAFVLFLTFMVVLADMTRVCYNWVSLQYAVNEGARFGSLGLTSGGLDHQTSVQNKVISVARSLGVQGVGVSFSDAQGRNTTGAPLTFFRLKAQKTVTLNPVSDLILKISGDYHGDYTVTAESITRNEPFGS